MRFGKGRTRGISLIWMMIGMVALCACVSLGVDYGRVQLAKSELRAAADAAARAGMAALSTSVTAAEDAAISAAAANKVDGQPLVLRRNQDIEFGTWDAQRRTFTPLTGAARSSANAVRILAQRTRERGNGIPLMFTALLGRDACDVRTHCVASRPDGGFGVVGLDYIRMTGNTTSSYWSTTGAPATNLGSIASNGSISLNGASWVGGDARPGVGQQVYGAAGRVAGRTAPLSAPLVYPTPSAGSFTTNNDNARIPSRYLSSNALNLGHKDHYTMLAGVYYFDGVSLTGSAQLDLAGPVVIYTHGNVDIAGKVLTAGNLPRNLRIVAVPRPNGSPPGTVRIWTQSDLYADIYAPLSPIEFGAQGAFYGSLVGKSVDMTGGASIHYDLAINNAGISIVQ